MRTGSCAIAALALFAGACSARGSGSQVPAEQRARALEQRAATLIARLLDTPGSIASGGHIYAFITDEKVLNELVNLGHYAVPALIACSDDARPSKVVYTDFGSDSLRPMLRGAVCLEALSGTSFFQMRDEELMARAAADIGCVEAEDGPPNVCGRYAGWVGYNADAAELRRAKRLWRRYLYLYREENHPQKPRLALTSVGCYTLRLRPGASASSVVDSTRTHHFRLDTLPLPGTVHPARLELAEDLVAGDSAHWGAHYENRVLVSWSGPEGTHLGINFGGSDSALASFVLWRKDADVKEMSGRVRVTRVACPAR